MPMIRLTALALAGATSPAHAATAACPGKTFDAFFAAFADSAAIQRAHVADPLSSGEIDPEAQPEPAMVTKSLQASQIKFPVMPGNAERQREGLAISKAPKPGGAIEVLLAKADTGYQLRYTFSPKGNCWQLAAMADESM